jgi:hypothetical protein
MTYRTSSPWETAVPTRKEPIRVTRKWRFRRSIVHQSDSTDPARMRSVLPQPARGTSIATSVGMSANRAKFSTVLENLKTNAGWVLLLVGTLVATHGA